MSNLTATTSVALCQDVSLAAKSNLGRWLVRRACNKPRAGPPQTSQARETLARETRGLKPRCNSRNGLLNRVTTLLVSGVTPQKCTCSVGQRVALLVLELLLSPKCKSSNDPHSVIAQNRTSARLFDVMTHDKQSFDCAGMDPIRRLNTGLSSAVLIGVTIGCGGAPAVGGRRSGDKADREPGDRAITGHQ
ncbi:hypothetical protein KQX54_019200 [Cotesia glomerata]|uniref:Uncharacterized protein n=1 Tax=Cotesia glomerata TaxID=32391 RepID=A0AAV7IB18_COTGL|nr:hypothetical protein KQX54_019200 [Cotesia glomerata]